MPTRAEQDELGARADDVHGARRERPAGDGAGNVGDGRLAGRSDMVSDGGAFATPVGGDAPASIGPGGAYEFSVEASPGESPSLAAMFVQPNDLFYAPEPRGVALFDGEKPLSGDWTDSLDL